MPDQKVTDLTALTGAAASSSDLALVVDVSDTSMDATGTDKKMTLGELAIAVRPAWWTVVNTTNAETVDFAGPVSITPALTRTTGALTLYGTSDPMEDDAAAFRIFAAVGAHDTHLMDGYAGDGTQTFEVRPDGGVSVFAAAAAAGLTIYLQAIDAGGNPLFVVEDASGTTAFAPTAVITPMTVRGAVGQTAPLLDVLSDSGEFTVLANGGLRFDASVGAADADLYAGSVSLYFDPTNGSATPKWKGKQADGTVVSGSLGGGTTSFVTIAKWSR